jgi:hypothetical protein
MVRQTDAITFFRILSAQFDEVQRRFNRSAQSLVANLDALAGRAAATEAHHPALAELNETLADLAFMQAQENDLLSQMMRGLGLALARLPGDTDTDNLACGYISENQHSVHASVLERLADDD